LVWIDNQVPSIFPEDHNQNKGALVFSNFRSPDAVFDPMFEIPPIEAEVCSETNFDDLSCALYWCEVQQGHVPKEDGQCECFRKETPARGTCGVQTDAEAKTRIIGPTIAVADLQGPLGDYLESGGYGVSLSTPRVNSMTWQELSPMVLNEWEDGVVNLRTMTQIKTTMNRDEDSAACGWQEVCFCGTYVCKMPSSANWQPVYNGALHLESAINLFSSGTPASRLLQDTNFGSVPVNMRARVEVVFGLEIELSAPLVGKKDLDSSWQFQVTYEARQPWAQRNMLTLCEGFPQSMLVVEKRCWIDDFQKWVKDQDERFPVPASKFDSLSMTFAQDALTGLAASKEYLWIRNGEVRASFMSFSIDISKYASTEVALDHMAKWDEYVDDFNREASRFAKGAFHVADLWVRAQAQAELISSTILTLALVIILAFAGMLVFTRDPILSFFVVCATISVVSGLAWFIVGLMGWSVGPIEVIALIVFIGYAVTYSLHIAHKYGSEEALMEDPRGLEGAAALRYQRTNFAMKSIGGAAFGSAVTTAGCSFFLIPCTLTIFQKLGGVVLAVTLMSIFTALVPLPAALLLMGPTKPGCKKIPTAQEMWRSSYQNVMAAQKNVSESGKRLTESGRKLSELSSQAYSNLPKAPKAPSMPNMRGIVI
jgi:hypothetical protein